MKTPVKSLLIGVIAAAGVAAAASSASAAVVCNGEGECWHVHKSYNYEPGWGVTVHPNNWKWGANDHYKWREHAGRGYWRNGVWIKF